jgi:hypothetical protein
MAFTSLLVRFARICNNMSYFNDRDLVITEKLLLQGYHFHILLKTFTKFYYRYARDLIQKGISQPCCYCDVINKAKKLKSDTSKLVKFLKNLIRKDYDLAIIVNSLRQVYFAKK